MKVVSRSTIYENPLPQLRSRQAFFPWLCETKDKKIIASFAIGEAFESVDSASYISESLDGGKMWSAPQRMFDFHGNEDKLTDYAKVISLPDGRLAAFGYTFLRDDPELPIGNPENGGLLDDFIFCSISEDNGKSWGELQKIDCKWGAHAEASAPLTVLKDGTWITPITGFADWNGKLHSDMCGRALISHDEGKTWNDDAVCMDFGGNVTCFEQRLCQLESGAILCIGWNENTETGERMCNHYTVSYDNGKTWSKPISTGILGQASSICALGGEKLLALHSVRRDTDRPGIYAYVIDFSERTWKIVDECIIFEPIVPVMKDNKMADIFSFLKFGQPGAILLSDGDILMSHWYAQDGRYQTVATRIKL